MRWRATQHEFDMGIARRFVLQRERRNGGGCRKETAGSWQQVGRRAVRSRAMPRRALPADACEAASGDDAKRSPRHVAR